MRLTGHRLAKYVWASPNTALGVVLGLGVLVLGGRARVTFGAIEFSGGLLKRAQALAPRSLQFGAITFGHVILAINEAELDSARAHEHVHVRQYERWGPLFLPAYVISSLWQALHGRRLYHDNRFEREAYGRERTAPQAANDHR